MNVDGLIQFEALLQRLDQVSRMAFGVGLREFAVAVSRAGDHTAADVRLFRVESQFSQRLLDRRDVCVRDVGNDQVLPNCEPDFARAVEIRDFREAQHLLGCDLPHRHCHADVVQTPLLLREHADMRMRQLLAGIFDGRRIKRRALQRMAESFSVSARY